SLRFICLYTSLILSTISLRVKIFVGWISQIDEFANDFAWYLNEDGSIDNDKFSTLFCKSEKSIKSSYRRENPAFIKLDFFNSTMANS
ncbi:MAG: hypothetical protein EBS19_14615, partial [Spirochaetia bacterium]|nr:hypothetical protein [Spirochaetia bacterium]